MYDTLFKNRKLNTKKLLLFGFAAENGAYTYITDIAEGQLKMTVTLSEKGTVSATVADPFLNEEYVLHRAAGACGPFVGKVRADYESVLKEISELCFEPDVFKSEQAKKVIEYVRHAYGGELEFLWQRSPKNAVFRRKDTRKWYGALLVLPENKLGLASGKLADVLDLRIHPEDMANTVDKTNYFPGYHMNKKHWYSILLNGSLPDDEIFNRIDVSYELAIK